MRGRIAISMFFALATAGFGFAGGDAAAHAAIERAIAFHGGAAALRNLPVLELEGTYESGRWQSGRRFDVVREEAAGGASRTEVTFEFHGRKVTPVEIYDGASLHKRRFRTEWDDLPLDEPREEAAHRIDFLLTALDRDATVVGDGDEGGVPVTRVSVPDGRGTAILSFAKDDGRLVALEYPGTDAAGMGTKKEITRKVIYRDERQVGQLRLPFDVETLSDGSLANHLRWTSMKVLDRFDPDWVRVPDPTRRFVPAEELAF